MRPTQVLAGIALLLLSEVTAGAQSVLYSAVVNVPEAEVRCGPSLDAKMYPTNRLTSGDAVHVLEERPDGWLAIKPPRGSFSWINLRFLQKLGPFQWSVENEVPVPVLYGSQLVNARPTVESVKVPRGTIVVSVGEPNRTGEISQTGLDGTWLPIEPPPTEKRYLRPDVVQRSTTLQTASSKPGPTPPPPLAGTTTTAPYTADARPVRNVDPLWLQAQRAEQEGKIEEAEQLYAQVASQTPDHDLAIACQNRIRNLYELKQSQRRAGSSPARLTNVYPLNSAMDSRLASVPPSLSAQARPSAAPGQPGRAQSQYTYAPDAPPVAVRVGSSPAHSTSGPGWLSRTGGWFVDNKPAYALVDDQGQLRLYGTAGPGVSLETYVNKRVELHGPITYRGELKANHMTVMQVVPLP